MLVNNRTFAKAEGGRVHVQVQARQLTLRTQGERQGKASTWITQRAHSCPIENSLFTVTSVKCKSRWVRHLFVSVYKHSFHVSTASGHLFPRRVCHLVQHLYLLPVCQSSFTVTSVRRCVCSTGRSMPPQTCISGYSDNPASCSSSLVGATSDMDSWTAMRASLFAPRLLR